MAGGITGWLDEGFALAVGRRLARTATISSARHDRCEVKPRPAQSGCYARRRSETCRIARSDDRTRPFRERGHANGQQQVLADALFSDHPGPRLGGGRQDRLVGYVAVSLAFSTWAAGDYLHMDCLYLREVSVTRASALRCSQPLGFCHSARHRGDSVADTGME